MTDRHSERELFNRKLPIEEHEKQESDFVTVTRSNSNVRDMQPYPCYRYVGISVIIT